MTPVKDFNTPTPEQPLRKKPLAVGFGCGMCVIYSRYNFLAAPLPEGFRSGRFTSETATWIQKFFKTPVGTSRKL
jgi:hypothetical protein